jgi:tetratricopeptide (TPR) repeat protein
MNFGCLILYGILFVVLFAINPAEVLIWVLIFLAWGFVWPWLNRNKQRFGQFSPLWFMFVSLFFILYVVLRIVFSPVVAVIIPSLVIALCAQYVLAVPYLIAKEHYTLADQLLTFQQQLHPTWISLKFQRVNLLTAQFRHEEALRAVNQIIDTFTLKSDDPRGNLIPVNDNTVNAYTQRATLALNLKNHELALLDAERVVRMKPDNASSYLLRGAVYRALNRFEQAHADFDHAKSLQPASPKDPDHT